MMETAEMGIPRGSERRQEQKRTGVKGREPRKYRGDMARVGRGGPKGRMSNHSAQ